ncbi:DMT family transporter [Propylenella binzhouense]|uniref:DMT family transporter n=1 Tax=Propylenella binzhouense TaxID=2555902 RepID=A0A964T4Z3_9HYPH|nr:DMT family transporter [Propylenella binzhouense]MYZ48553.1 DMT family transporter [Propylenella binzhouense]
MTPPDWLWAVCTVLAATAQTVRNAAQRSLIGEIGTVGATHIRFLFGFPFALLAVAVLPGLGIPLPRPNLVFMGWVTVGSLLQMAAMALLLSAMRTRSFVVVTAYTKTEPVQVAIFALLVLHEPLTVALAGAVLIATVGVMIMSWPSKAQGETFTWRPALFGVVSGGLFALAAVCFRGALTNLDADFLPGATFTLGITLGIQSLVLTIWLLLRDPGVLAAILRKWRPSLGAGFLGAFASEMWFVAFALEAVARVRTLGLVEMVVAAVISRRVFAQTPSVRESIGMTLVIAGVVLLLTS